MSYVVKCALRRVDHIDLSPEAMTARNDDWKSRTGFLGLKGGITTYFLFDTEENANAFADSHREDPLVIGGLPTTTVMPLEDADGLTAGDFYIP